ncbi:hypothetical protein [Nocardioides mangrovi]|uniref:Uncharacterized protein n=1 Tax=Nocardioides mangrovi TaxID=2874580 RepID=A0ABS7UDW1_9ACTN|nr:hypothetical protein [Nocardioides mangrovi]MBZ5739195.1 hypothetical protein [Nocardioides mangrovi]
MIETSIFLPLAVVFFVVAAVAVVVAVVAVVTTVRDARRTPAVVGSRPVDLVRAA